MKTFLLLGAAHEKLGEGVEFDNGQAVCCTDTPGVRIFNDVQQLKDELGKYGVEIHYD